MKQIQAKEWERQETKRGVKRNRRAKGRLTQSRGLQLNPRLPQKPPIQRKKIEEKSDLVRVEYRNLSLNIRPYITRIQKNEHIQLTLPRIDMLIERTKHH